MATLRATSSFDAPGRFVTAGEEVDSSDPIVKGREALFETISEPVKATAAKKAPAKKAAPKAKA